MPSFFGAPSPPCGSGFAQRSLWKLLADLRYFLAASNLTNLHFVLCWLFHREWDQKVLPLLTPPASPDPLQAIPQISLCSSPPRLPITLVSCLILHLPKPHPFFQIQPAWNLAGWVGRPHSAYTLSASILAWVFPLSKPWSQSHRTVTTLSHLQTRTWGSLPSPGPGGRRHLQWHCWKLNQMRKTPCAQDCFQVEGFESGSNPSCCATSSGNLSGSQSYCLKAGCQIQSSKKILPALGL